MEFRKSFNDEVVIKINEMILEYNLPECYADEKNDNNDDDDNSDSSNDSDEEFDTSKNSGTLIIDATFAPQNIKYPQDINRLNEACEKLEGLIKISVRSAITMFRECIASVQEKII